MSAELAARHEAREIDYAVASASAGASPISLPPVLKTVLPGLLARGHGFETLCIYLALARTALLNLVVALGVPTPHDRPHRRAGGRHAWAPEDIPVFIALWVEGWSAHSMAERFGRSSGSIYSKARQIGLRRRDRSILHRPADPHRSVTPSWRAEGLQLAVIEDAWVPPGRTSDAPMTSARSTAGSTRPAPSGRPGALMTRTGTPPLLATSFGSVTADSGSITPGGRSTVAAHPGISPVRQPDLPGLPVGRSVGRSDRRLPRIARVPQQVPPSRPPQPPPPPQPPLTFRSLPEQGKPSAEILRLPPRADAGSVDPRQSSKRTVDRHWTLGEDEQLVHRTLAGQHYKAIARDMGLTFKQVLSRRTRLFYVHRSEDKWGMPRMSRRGWVDSFDPDVALQRIKKLGLFKHLCGATKKKTGRDFYFWTDSRFARFSKPARDAGWDRDCAYG